MRANNIPGFPTDIPTLNKLFEHNPADILTIQLMAEEALDQVQRALSYVESKEYMEAAEALGAGKPRRRLDDTLVVSTIHAMALQCLLRHLPDDQSSPPTSSEEKLDDPIWLCMTKLKTLLNKSSSDQRIPDSSFRNTLQRQVDAYFNQPPD